MKDKLAILCKQTKSSETVAYPLFFRLNNASDNNKLTQLLKETPDINVFDELQGQLEELVKSQNPKIVFTKSALTEAAKKHIGSIPSEEYGVWVYYPWSKKLIHILDEKEFVEVRTNRNHYKITPEEEKILATKKIGVIGLSVGKAIALTIAMERICSELRIADFDVIELSNLNRIQTGVQNFGIKKTIVVAREISEIDPYLKVTWYSDGLTEANADDFFLKDGKLDVCIEVCDGLYTKIFTRQKAKSLRIPVVMNSSDKGTTDIERYDLNPELPILHGLIDHLDLSLVKQAKTNEEKVPYLLPMLGVETSSTRLRASMLEIEQTITTWPQLASGVVLGGGICADVCRRVLLNQLHDSGRYFVDLEEVIKDKNTKEYIEQPLNIKPSLSDKEMLDIIHSAHQETWNLQIDLPENTIKQLAEAASKAPSGANSQTWKWMYHNKNLYFFFDDVFRPDLLDCQRTTMITGLGAAAENLVLKAHELGLEVAAQTVEINDDTKLITTFRFFDTAHAEIKDKLEPHVCDHLSKTINSRVSNRTIVQRKTIEKNRLNKLQEIARTIPGADMIIIDDEDKLIKLSEITAKMDRIRYLSKGGHNDFRGEARWTIEEAERTRNGISFQETMDLTPTEFAGFFVSKDWSVVKHLADWELGSAFGKIQRKWIRGSAAVGLLTVPSFTTNNFYQGGRALERVWLAANHDNISTHPPSLSILIFNTLVYGKKDALPDNMRKEATTLLKELEDLFGINPQKGKVLLMRFIIDNPPKFRSLRYPLDQVLKFTNSII
ncbi:MAG: Rv1355c family protein [Bacteroidetes bacterium]|nr:Rv1355c family protein [Bacteroidota bacterium]